jgi:hypothetical protein
MYQGHQFGASDKGDPAMFTKTMIALSTALLLATALGSAANAQTTPKGVSSYTAAEKLWFQIPEAADRMD